jgi:hypothetical protein
MSDGRQQLEADSSRREKENRKTHQYSFSLLLHKQELKSSETSCEILSGKEEPLGIIKKLGINKKLECICIYKLSFKQVCVHTVPCRTW